MLDLLQTAAYTRAVISTVGLYATPREVEAKVAARMARQAILTKPDPHRLVAILDTFLDQIAATTGPTTWPPRRRNAPA